MSTRVPFNALTPGEDAVAVRAAIDRVIASGWFVLGPEVEATHRLERIREARWWSLAEIESCREPLFPTDLADRLRALHAPR